METTTRTMPRPAPRTLRRREAQRGQSIVIGVGGLFIMALSVIATLNLGQAIHDRIKLQNAADAAAYSIAAREARAFNYFAFANRTQAAHYSAAMTVQSYLSFATFSIAVMGTAADMSWNAATGQDQIASLNIWYLSQIYRVFATISEIWGDVLGILRMIMGYALEYLDPIVASFVEGFASLNASVGRAEVNEGLRVNRLLITGGYPILKQNDPDLDFRPPNAMFFLALLNATLNTIEYRRTFDEGASQDCSIVGLIDQARSIGSWGAFRIQSQSQDPAQADPDVDGARRLMTEVANATRLGPSGGSKLQHFVTDRSDFMPNLMFAIPMLNGGRHGQTRLIDTESRVDSIVPHPRVDRMEKSGGTAGWLDPFRPWATGLANRAADQVDQWGNKVGGYGSKVGSAASKVGGSAGSAGASAAGAINKAAGGLHDFAKNIRNPFGTPPTPNGATNSADSNARPLYHAGSVLAADDYIEGAQGGFFVLFGSLLQPVNAIGGAVVSVTTEDSGLSLTFGDSSNVGYHYGYNLENAPTTWSSGMGRVPANRYIGIALDPLTEAGWMAATRGRPTTTYPTLDDDTHNFEGHQNIPGLHGHRWPGIQPFVDMNPQPHTSSGSLGDHGQPSTWIFAHIPPDRLNQAGTSAQKPWSYHFQFSMGGTDTAGETRDADGNVADWGAYVGGRTHGGVPELDTTIGTSRQAIIPFMTGLNSIARGMVYYHRPAGGRGRGNWQEQPNFFNPYWSARLAPVAEKLKQLYDAYIGNAIRLPEGSSPILSGGINLLRNALGDIFFHIITSIMTH